MKTLRTPTIIFSLHIYTRSFIVVLVYVNIKYEITLDFIIIQTIVRNLNSIINY